VRCNCAAAVNDPAVASTAEEDDKNNERGRWWQFWRRRRRRRVTTTSSSTTRSEEQQRQQPPAQPPPSPQPQQLFNMSGPMWVAPLQDPEMLDQMAQLAIEWGWDEDEVSPFFTHSLTHSLTRSLTHSLTHSLCTSLLPFSFGYFPLSYNGPTTHSVNLIQLTNPPVRS
jgi:hypothetical protein